MARMMANFGRAWRILAENRTAPVQHASRSDCPGHLSRLHHGNPPYQPSIPDQALMRERELAGGFARFEHSLKIRALERSESTSHFGAERSIGIMWSQRSIPASCLCRLITWVRTKRPPTQILGLRTIGEPCSGWGCYTAHISVVIQMRTPRP